MGRGGIITTIIDRNGPPIRRDIYTGLIPVIICQAYYPSALALLTGWIHHISYFILMLALLYHNRTNSFAMFCVEELPTMILNIGIVNKEHRSDFWFGTTFLATRLFYHGWGMAKLWGMREGLGDGYRWIAWVPIGPMALHCMWFRGFVLQQIRRVRRVTTTGKAL